MSDTPDQSKPLPEDPSSPAAERAPQEAPVSPPQVKVPSKPVKAPSMTVSSSSEPAKAPSEPTSAPSKPKPVSVTPAAKKQPVKRPDAGITFDEQDKDEGPSTPMLVIDGLAAAVSIAFTVLILQDVMPFL